MDRHGGEMTPVLRLTALAALAVPLCWTAVAYAAAEQGTPFCPSKLRFAARGAVVRQAAWSYLLNKEPSERAARGEEGQSYLPTTPMNDARVEAFLRDHPDCCQIQPIAMSGSWLDRILIRAIRPSITYVEVKARPQRPIYYGDVYEVDACWENLRTR